MVDFGSITVSKSLAVGGVIATQRSTPQWTSKAICGRNEGISIEGKLLRYTTPVTGAGTKVYATSIPGVGIRIRTLFRNGSQADSYFPYSSAGSAGPGGFAHIQSDFSVELIKTASTVASGTLASGPVADRLLNGISTIRLGMETTTIVSEDSTCKVTTTSLAFPLGNVAASAFANVGSTSSTSSTQNINLTCTANPSVYMTLTGTRASSSAPASVLTLTASTGTAQGIGAQLLYRNPASGTLTPLDLDTRITLSSGAGATLSVPIAARYYRFGTVAAGSANSKATLQFTYN